MSRCGFALVFVLLVMAAVELLTISTLSLATHENAVADAQLRTAVAARAAEAALGRLSNDWPLAALDTLAVGRTRTFLMGGGVTVRVERAAWGSFYATATAPVGKTTLRRSAILRQLDVERGLTESNEAVAAAGSLAAPRASFSIDDVSTCSLPLPAEQAPALITLSSRRHALAVPDARIDSLHAVLPTGYALAGIRWDELAGIADVVLSDAVELTLVDSSGAPAYPLLYAPGDLTVTGGAGQGLLFVAGNLEMSGHAQFTGIIVVRGTATVHDGAGIEGALRLGGAGISVIGAAHITYSRCASARVLLETPAARRLIKAHRVYIPAF